MSTEPGSEPVRADGMHRLGGSTPGDRWHQARSTCTACGGRGLLDEGWLTDTGEGAKGFVRWVMGTRDTSLFGGLSSWGADRYLVRAFRCRECRHLELFAEEHE